jgi:predicted flavoprotein YhiN
MMCWDVAIIGGGPAGLMAAALAAQRGKKTILLDKNREPGVKILLSGGTRCNLTHDTDVRGIVEAFGPNGRFLYSALAAFGPQTVVDYFEAKGVPTKVEPGGKVFPVSDRASDVRDALVRVVEQSGCTLAMGETLSDLVRVFGFSPLPLGEGQGVRATAADSTTSPHPNPLPKGEGTGERFRLVTSKRSFEAEKVVLTTGGQSYPACGTTGDGYRFAAALGHRIVLPHTALVPITSHAPWVLALQGITLPDVFVQVINVGDGKKLANSRGALLFAHFGVTGPVVLDVSHAVSAAPQPDALALRCDLMPEITESKLDAQLAERCAMDGKRRVATLLDSWVPHRIGETLLALSGVAPDCPSAEFSKASRQRLVGTVKRLDIPVAGTMGFRKAELTAGGVALEEVDSRTMQSRIVPGLFFAGELLDLNGPVGGYNFQAAFSTGRLAGENV